MNEVSPAIVPDLPRPKRSLPLRFSLWTLCVIVAIACVGAAWYGMRQREREAMEKAAALAAHVESLRQENDRLRAEIGYLTITDRKKVHALGQRSLSEYHWRWRVYLPPGKQWRLCQALGKIPRHGDRDVPHASSTIDAGEFTIEAFFSRNADRQPRFVVAHGGGSSSQTIDEQQLAELGKVGFSSSGIGQKRTEVFDTLGPIVLIRLRQHEAVPGSPGSFRTSDEPQFGFLLWLE